MKINDTEIPTGATDNRDANVTFGGKLAFFQIKGSEKFALSALSIIAICLLSVLAYWY